MTSTTTQLSSNRSGSITRALGPVTAANAVLYLVAAVLHLGVRLPLGFATLGFPQPIPQASVAEGLIGAVLAAAGGTLFFRGYDMRGLVWAAYGFALVGTLFGLTIVSLRGLGGPDLAIHFAMLAGLASGLALLFTGRRSRERLGQA